MYEVCLKGVWYLMPYLRQCRNCGFNCWNPETMRVHKKDCKVMRKSKVTSGSVGDKHDS